MATWNDVVISVEGELLSSLKQFFYVLSGFGQPFNYLHPSLIKYLELDGGVF